MACDGNSDPERFAKDMLAHTVDAWLRFVPQQEYDGETFVAWVRREMLTPRPWPRGTGAVFNVPPAEKTLLRGHPPFSPEELVGVRRLLAVRRGIAGNVGLNNEEAGRLLATVDVEREARGDSDRRRAALRDALDALALECSAATGGMAYVDELKVARDLLAKEGR